MQKFLHSFADPNVVAALDKNSIGISFQLKTAAKFLSSKTFSLFISHFLFN